MNWLTRLFGREPARQTWAPPDPPPPPPAPFERVVAAHAQHAQGIISKREMQQVCDEVRGRPSAISNDEHIRSLAREVFHEEIARMHVRKMKQWES